jgi:hypothetical protein
MNLFDFVLQVIIIYLLTKRQRTFNKQCRGVSKKFDLICGCG